MSKNAKLDIFGADTSRTFRARSKVGRRFNMSSNNRSTLNIRDSLNIEDDSKKPKRKRRPVRTKNRFDEIFPITPDKKTDAQAKENTEPVEDSLMSSKYWHEASSAESCNAEVLTKEPPKPCKTRPAATNYVSSSSSDDDSVDRPEAKYLPRRIDNKRQKKPLQSIANRLMKSPSHTMSTPLGVRGKAYIGLPKMSSIGTPLNKFNETSNLSIHTPVTSKVLGIAADVSASPIKPIEDLIHGQIHDVSSDLSMTADSDGELFSPAKMEISAEKKSPKFASNRTSGSGQFSFEVLEESSVFKTPPDILAPDSLNSIHPGSPSPTRKQSIVNRSANNSSIEITTSIKAETESAEIQSETGLNKTAVEFLKQRTLPSVVVPRLEKDKLIKTALPSSRKPKRVMSKVKQVEYSFVYKKKESPVKAKCDIETENDSFIFVDESPKNVNDVSTNEKPNPRRTHGNLPHPSGRVSNNSRKRSMAPGSHSADESNNKRGRKTVRLSADLANTSTRVTPRSKARERRRKQYSIDPLMNTPSRRQLPTKRTKVIPTRTAKETSPSSVKTNKTVDTKSIVHNSKEHKPEIAPPPPPITSKNANRRMTRSSLVPPVIKNPSVKQTANTQSAKNNRRSRFSSVPREQSGETKSSNRTKQKERANSSDHFDANIFCSPISAKSDFKTPLRRKTTAANRSQFTRRSHLSTTGVRRTEMSILESTCVLNRKRLSTAFFMKRVQQRICPADETVDFQPTADREYALQKLGQKKPSTLFQFLTRNKLSSIVKVGEGVFGEVFCAKQSGNNTILKIIPVDGTTIINSSPQKPIREVIGEYLISKTLEESNLDGFCTVKKASLCNGVYPQLLKTAWDTFAKQRNSENDRPWEVLSKTQLYIVLQMEHCGEDLDSQRLTATEAIRILKLITQYLAKAEVACEFEHRDLHAGNILIRRNNETGEIEPTIIDFTLSRAKAQDANVIYADLEYDHEIFEGDGDPQFDVYRDMQLAVDRNWSQYQPKTNVYWIAFIAGWLGRNIPPTTKTKGKLRSLQKSLRRYKTANDIVIRLDAVFNQH